MARYALGPASAPFLVIGLLIPGGSASGQGSANAAHKVETTVLARLGLHHKVTYRFLEVIQSRDRWIVPDLGYIDFGDPGRYFELWVGGGAVLVGTKRLTIVGEGYFAKAIGPDARGAAYLQPWVLVDYRVAPRLALETVYLRYLPLNQGGTSQDLLERAKLEYGFGSLKAGVGYSGYRFGKAGWQHRPFVTATFKSRLGSFEVWAQRLSPPDQAGHNFQAQVRYAVSFR